MQQKGNLNVAHHVFGMSPQVRLQVILSFGYVIAMVALESWRKAAFVVHVSGEVRPVFVRFAATEARKTATT